MSATPRPQCAFPICPFPATRQAYAKEFDATEPWRAENYVPYCAGHAPRDSWPLEVSE